MKLCTTLATSKWKRKSCIESDVKQEHQKKEGMGDQDPYKT